MASEDKAGQIIWWAWMNARKQRIADSGGKFGWKTQLLILDALTIGEYLGVSVCEIKWVSGILFGLSIMLVNCMMPLVAAVLFVVVCAMLAVGTVMAVCGTAVIEVSAAMYRKR